MPLNGDKGLCHRLWLSCATHRSSMENTLVWHRMGSELKGRHSVFEVTVIANHLNWNLILLNANIPRYNQAGFYHWKIRLINLLSSILNWTFHMHLRHPSASKFFLFKIPSKRVCSVIYSSIENRTVTKAQPLAFTGNILGLRCQFTLLLTFIWVKFWTSLSS